MAAASCNTAFSASARGHAGVQRQPCPVAIAPAWGTSENRRTPCAQGVLAHWRFRTQRLAAGAHRHPAPQDRRVADHRQPQPPAARIEYRSPTMENQNAVRGPENPWLQSGGHAYDRSGQALNPDRDPGDGGRRGLHGLWALRGQPRRCKGHGRPARSLFALGLDALRKLCASRTFAQSLQILLGLLIGNSMESLLYSEA